ncbi:hypothetical protein LEMLEM_LOCUS793, partial [Lemmus lemmus]
PLLFSIFPSPNCTCVCVCVCVGSRSTYQGTHHQGKLPLPPLLVINCQQLLS